MNPEISIIMPVYNSEAYLKPCLDSIFAQSFTDYQLICVNDGSTDNSLAVLESYKKDHDNMEIYSQNNLYAGVARNLGMRKALGNYLLFLDADDTFSPDFFKEMYEKITETQADICVCGVNQLDAATGELSYNPRYLKKKYLPKNSVFCKDDIPDYIFHFTSVTPWNKMFSASFIKEQKLEFQPLRRTNDLYFVTMAFACAGKITTIDKPLVNYRVGHGSNLQANNSDTPLLFAEALKALKASLQERGLFRQLEIGFVNTALHHCIYNLSSQKSPSAYSTVYTALKESLFEEFLISTHKEEDFYVKSLYGEYENIMKYSCHQYLFYKMKQQKEKISTQKQTIDKLKTENTALKKQAKDAEIQKKKTAADSKKPFSFFRPSK